MYSHARRLTSYPLDELITLARTQSPFYQRAYAHLPEKPSLMELPVIDQASYWEAHARDPREILTEPLRDGLVLNSGGSTGTPKFSYYNDEEWDSAVTLIASAVAETGLHDGDRVANLFASGYLYTSFALLQEALKAIPARVLQLPIGWITPIPDAMRFIRAFRVNVLAGVPTHIMNLLEHAQKEGITDLNLTHVLFAGEPFTADQRKGIQSLSPGVQVRSIGYASVDAGTMGFADLDCAMGEHRGFEGPSILEIVDENTGEPIEETGRSGRIVFTNLTRRLMPTLRYPTGDRGQWVEPAGTPSRKFVLLGRTEESVRLATFNLSVSEMAVLLEPFRDRLGIQQFQLLVTKENMRDLLTLRFVSSQSEEARAAGAEEILATLYRQKISIADMIAKGILNPARVEWITSAQLEINPRTGKVRTTVDKRFE